MIYWFSGGGADDEFAWPALPMLGWGIGVAAHAASVFLNSPARRDAHEREVQREIERERARLEKAGLLTKRKRDALYRLSDDGELIEVTDDEVDVKYKREG